MERAAAPAAAAPRLTAPRRALARGSRVAAPGSQQPARPVPRRSAAFRGHQMSAVTASAVAAATVGGAHIIDGKAIADTVRKEVAEKVAAMKAKTGKDSETYVRSKKKACAECGIASFGTDLPETATEEEVLAVVARYNADPEVHGVLVQLPLPAHVNEERVLSAISLEKDVDGFHPINIGRLAMRGRDPLFVPCTPKGCIELLERSGVAIKGKRAVVIGRSNIVGMPAAMLLQRRDATVTVVHSRTPEPERIIREADIVIAAVGVPEFVKASWLKPGCAVIDVGINPVPDASKKTGYRLVGDVAYAEALPIAGAITPVPGGVGPMTIAMLLSNTVEGATRAWGL